MTASTAGHVGMPLLSAYSTSKFGLVGWAEALAYELPKGVSVEVIVPGSMKTGFFGLAQMATHSAYAANEERANRLYAALADGAGDATLEVIAGAVWDAAHDESGRIRPLVPSEAREMVGAREAISAQGYRNILLARLDV